MLHATWRESVTMEGVMHSWNDIPASNEIDRGSAIFACCYVLTPWTYRNELALRVHAGFLCFATLTIAICVLKRVWRVTQK